MNFSKICSLVFFWFLVGAFLAMPVNACTYGSGGYGNEIYQVPCSSQSTVPVYRFYSQELTTHFYTANEAEKDFIVSNYPQNVWNLEGINFYTVTNVNTSAIPVYRFWSSRFGRHFYTVNETERDYIIANYPTEVWNYEGQAMYALPLAYTGDARTVFRFFNGNIISHFYTPDEDEKLRFQNNPGWSYEGPAFKVAL